MLCNHVSLFTSLRRLALQLSISVSWVREKPLFQTPGFGEAFPSLILQQLPYFLTHTVLYLTLLQCQTLLVFFSSQHDMRQLIKATASISGAASVRWEKVTTSAQLSLFSSPLPPPKVFTLTEFWDAILRVHAQSWKNSWDGKSLFTFPPLRLQ